MYDKELAEAQGYLQLFVSRFGLNAVLDQLVVICLENGQDKTADKISKLEESLEE